MRAWVAVPICWAGLACFTPVLTAQDDHSQQSKPAKAAEIFFSGNVVTVDTDKLTVTRRTLTLSWITKTFLLDANTKVEGILKPKARVTVKFEKTDDGDRAIHIIVR